MVYVYSKGRMCICTFIWLAVFVPIGWWATAPHSYLMSNDLLKLVSTNAMSLTTLLFVLLYLLKPQNQGRWCIGTISISCLLFLIWCEHQHRTLYLFVWGLVNSARPAWRSSNLASNCLLFILQWTSSVPISQQFRSCILVRTHILFLAKLSLNYQFYLVIVSD